MEKIINSSAAIDLFLEGLSSHEVLSLLLESYSLEDFRGWITEKGVFLPIDKYKFHISVFSDPSLSKLIPDRVFKLQKDKRYLNSDLTDALVMAGWIQISFAFRASFAIIKDRRASTLRRLAQVYKHYVKDRTGKVEVKDLGRRSEVDMTLTDLYSYL